MNLVRVADHVPPNSFFYEICFDQIYNPIKNNRTKIKCRSAPQRCRAPCRKLHLYPEKLFFTPIGLKFNQDHFSTQNFTLIMILALNFPKQKIEMVHHASNLLSMGYIDNFSKCNIYTPIEQLFHRLRWPKDLIDHIPHTNPNIFIILLPIRGQGFSKVSYFLFSF